METISQMQERAVSEAVRAALGVRTAVSNQKGGVGKTTVTLNLGKELASRGWKVLLIGNDPQFDLEKAIFGDIENMPDEILQVIEGGNVRPGIANTYHLYLADGAKKVVPYVVSENLHIVGASKHLAEMSLRPMDVVYDFQEAVEELSKQYDFTFVDCPPAFGTLQNAAHASVQNVVIPTLLDGFSEGGIAEVMKTIETKAMQKLNPELKVAGILFNQVSTKKINVEELFANNIRETYGDLVFNTKINVSVRVRESAALRKSVTEYDSSLVQAQQYRDLADEFLRRLGV